MKPVGGFPVETEIWKCEWRLVLCDFLTSHVMAYFVPHAWYRNPWLLNGLRWDAFQCRAEWGGFDILSSHLPCVQPVVSASIRRYKPEREYQHRSISKLYHRASCWIFAACVLWVTLLNVFTFRTVYFQSVFGNSLGRHAGAYICVTCTWDISSVTGPAWHGMKLACESLLPWSAGHVIMNCLNSSGTQCKFTL